MGSLDFVGKISYFKGVLIALKIAFVFWMFAIFLSVLGLTVFKSEIILSSTGLLTSFFFFLSFVFLWIGSIRYEPVQ